jgi:cell division septation protein DedD
LNTIGGPSSTNGAIKRTKHVYGKGYPSSSSASSSYVVYPSLPGSDTYRQRHFASGPGRKLPDDDDSVRQSGDLSPAKRRRITKSRNDAPTKPRSSAVIEIDDDDDDDDVTELSSRPANAPVHASLDTTSPASTPPSNGSWNTASGSRSRAQSTSEFGAVDSLACSHRKKSRKPDIVQGPITTHRIPLDTGRTSHSASMVIDDDEFLGSERESARKQILGDFTQGSDKASTKHASVQGIKAVTSHHFSRARVNESTSNDYIQTADRSLQNQDLTEKNLREHRRVKTSGELEQDRISSSSDELAQPNVLAVSSRHNKKQIRPAQTANSGVKQKVTEGPPLNWSLIRARSADLDWIEASPGTQLSLLCNVEPWRIVESSARHNDTVKMEIHSKATVIKALTDTSTRIRLEGSRSSDNYTPVWDLEFVESANLTHLIAKLKKDTSVKIVYDKEE